MSEEKEYSVEEVTRKVEKYIEQLLPMPTCAEKKPHVTWKREQVRLNLYQRVRSVGPKELK